MTRKQEDFSVALSGFSKDNAVVAYMDIIGTLLGSLPAMYDKTVLDIAHKQREGHGVPLSVIEENEQDRLWSEFEKYLKAQ